MADFNKDTFSVTYKDDYRDSDNYHRILFNSGRPLQARELTQSQTIIQHELARFARNIFKEGSVVNPGGLITNPDYEFVKVQSLSSTNAPQPGDHLLDTTNSVKAEVLEVVPAENSDPDTIYIKYISAGTASTGVTSVKFSGNRILTVTNPATGGTRPNVVTTQSQPNNPTVGKGYKIAVNDGAYFVQGHFVQTQAQSLIISKYSNTPTTSIGFKVTEDIVTVADTDDLYDNQNVLPNRSAPGADRYRITLTLATSDTVTSTDNFIITNDMVNGEITQPIDKNTYNILGDEMAKRTFEESGNYVVEPFTANFTESRTSDNNLTLNISPGIAYVQGYRIEETAEKKIEVSKSRDTEIIESEAINANYGHYVQINTLKGIPDVSTLEQWNLYNLVGGGSDPSNTVIGTARIRHVSQSGGFYRFYIFDVQMNNNQFFRDVRSIGDGTDFRYGDLQLENSVAVIKEASNNNSFFSLPRVKPQSLSVISYTEQDWVLEATAPAATTISMPGLGTTQSYSDTSLWIVTDSVGAVVSPTITANGGNADIQNLPSSGSYHILYYVNKENQSRERTKNLVSDSATGTLTNNILTLPHADIYSFDAILNADSEDVSSQFETDDGQRDNFYDLGKITLRGGSYSGNVRVKYQYFQHGGQGDFFSVNSYANEVAYEDIPVYRQKNGISVDLRNVLDFRSVKNNSGGFSSIHELPRATDTIQADVTYYQSRMDVLVATPEGIQYIEGQPNAEPIMPSVPFNAMQLYTISMQPWVDDPNDLSMGYIDNRRYTMRDIGGIVERIDNVERAVSLSLLELETSTTEVFDSNGNNRFKNGFFADNFKDLLFSDVFSSQYNATLDLDLNVIRPFVNEKNAKLSYDSTASSNLNTVVKNSSVYLNYSDAVVTYQDLATTTVNVNPFDVILYSGTLDISPETDIWNESVVIGEEIVSESTSRGRDPVVTRRRPSGGTVNTSRRRREAWRGLLGMPPRRNPPRVVVNTFTLSGRRNRRSSLTRFAGGGQAANPLATNNTVGSFPIDTTIVDTKPTPSSSFGDIGSSTTTTNGNRTVVRTVVGRRVESVDLLPYIRSRRVFFRAQELAPNREHFLFFDGVNLADYVHQEDYRTFSEVSAPDDYLSGEYVGLLSHPETSGTLVTDAYGMVSGSFYIPNNSQIKFDAGVKEVKLLDISVNDDAQALSGAGTNYIAQGELTSLINQISVQTTIRVNPRPRPRPQPQQPTGRRRRRGKRKEPIAQSFQLANANGGFITSIDVFLATKSNTVPIRLEVRPVENGVPSQNNIMPGGVVTLTPNIDTINSFTEAPENLNEGTMDRIRSQGMTTFTFDRPLYLEGFTEYAFVLIANTQEYNVYVAEIEDFLVGSSSKRVTKQPTVGSFFMSQNAITWTPDQRRDMMFRLNRADFATSGVFNLENDSSSSPSMALQTDPLLTTDADSSVNIMMADHGFVIGDPVQISGFDDNTRYAGILGSSLNGTRTITKVDGWGFTYDADSQATASLLTGGSNVVSEANIRFNEMIPNLDVFNVEGTSATFNASIANGVSYSYANDVSAAAYATPTGRDILPGELVIFDNPKVIANSRIEATETQLGGSNRKSVEIVGRFSTSDTWVSPVLDLETASLRTYSNFVDDQDSDANASYPINNPISWVSETDPADGSSLSKHITVPVTLGQAAVGIKVLAGINRPSESRVDLYYRTLSEGVDDVLGNQSWVYIDADTVIGADQSRGVFREYEWTIGGLGGSLTEFNSFQLKFVFNSSNSSKVPMIKDLRAIALGT